MNKALNVLILLGIILVTSFVSFQYGIIVGTSYSEALIGPALYRCVNTLDGYLEKLNKSI